MDSTGPMSHRALVEACLVLRYFSVPELARHAGFHDPAVVRKFLSEHERWFAMNGDANEDPARADAVWSMRPEMIPAARAELAQAREESSEESSEEDPASMNWLDVSATLIQQATSSTSDKTTRRQLITARVYLERFEAMLWRHQCNVGNQLRGEIARLRSLRVLAGEAQSPAESADDRRVVKDAEARLQTALQDWSIDLGHELQALRLPYNDALSTLSVDNAVQWMLGDLGLSASSYLPAARAQILHAHKSPELWGAIRAKALETCSEVLRLPSAAPTLPAISVLAVYLRAHELVLPILSAHFLSEAGPSEQGPTTAASGGADRRIVYAALSRMSWKRDAFDSAGRNAAAACVFLIARGCSDEEFCLLAPGALTASSPDNGEGLSRLLIAHESASGAFFRTVGMALFAGGNLSNMGNAITQALKAGTGVSFIEALDEHGAGTLYDLGDQFALYPGDRLPVSDSNHDTTCIALSVDPDSPIAWRLSGLLTKSRWHGGRRAVGAAGSFTSRLRARRTSHSVQEGVGHE